MLFLADAVQSDAVLFGICSTDLASVWTVAVLYLPCAGGAGGESKYFSDVLPERISAFSSAACGYPDLGTKYLPIVWSGICGCGIFLSATAEEKADGALADAGMFMVLFQSGDSRLLKCYVSKSYILDGDYEVVI